MKAEEPERNGRNSDTRLKSEADLGKDIKI